MRHRTRQRHAMRRCGGGADCGAVECVSDHFRISTLAILKGLDTSDNAACSATLQGVASSRR